MTDTEKAIFYLKYGSYEDFIIDKLNNRCQLLKDTLDVEDLVMLDDDFERYIDKTINKLVELYLETKFKAFKEDEEFANDLKNVLRKKL